MPAPQPLPTVLPPAAKPDPDTVEDHADDWLGVESAHPLTWLPPTPPARGAPPC